MNDSRHRPLDIVIVTLLSLVTVEGVVLVSPTTVTENNGILTISVLNSFFVQDWQFTYETLSLTAVAGEDFVGTTSPTTVTVRGGNLIYSLIIRINDDNHDEDDETFLLRLTAFSTGDPDMNVTITIIDDDDSPISLTHPGNITVTEGADNVTLNISRADLSTETFNVTVDTFDNTATAQIDYSPLESVVLQFDDGELYKLTTIYIIDDSVQETLETFAVVVHDPVLVDNITVTVTIEDNDEAPRPPISLTHPGNITVTEGADNVTLNISRADLSTEAFNVTVDTFDNTATAQIDYSPLESVVLQFGVGELYKLTTIYIIDDSTQESLETFTVIVHGPALLENITVTVSIEDNEVTQPPTSVHFHCGRGESQPCLNNGICNHGDGTCDCSVSPGFEGVNCGIQTSNISTGCGCENGTCMDTGTTEVCVCQPGFTGDLCDRKAYFHRCEPNGFSVCLTPFSVSTFVGQIYVVGTSTECRLDLAPEPPVPEDNIVDWCRGYAAFIQFNSTCGKLGPNVIGEKTQYELRLKIQYTRTQLRSTDQELILTCQHGNENTAVWSIPDNTGSGSHSSVQRETALYLPASLSISRANGGSVDAPLNVGDEIVLCVSVSKVKFLEGIWIKSIVANNTRKGSDFRDLLLYEDTFRCENALGILTTPPVWKPNTKRHTMCLQMGVFYFTHDVALVNPALGFLVDVVVFQDAGDLTEAPCDTRHKRQTAGKKVLILAGTVHIKNLNSGNLSDHTTCPCSDWLILTTIVLGIVVCSMIVVIIILAIAIIVLKETLYIS